MIGQTIRTRRAIMAALRPLTGDRATGTIKAIAATGYSGITLPANTMLVAVPTSAAGLSQAAPELVFRTTTATAIATTPGTNVAATSLLGGARHNLPVASVLRYDPALVGVTATALAVADFTGGADATGLGAVKQILAFETLENVDAAQDLFLAKVRATPALVLAWAGRVLPESAGEGQWVRTDTWRLYVITSALQGGVQRGDEALDLIDRCEAYLIDRSSADHYVFSAPGIQIRSVDRVRLTPSSWVYALTFTTTTSTARIDHRTLGSDYDEWLNTQVDCDTATTPPLPVVDGAIWPMR